MDFFLKGKADTSAAVKGTHVYSAPNLIPPHSK